MTPNEMRANKAREITEAAQGLGWEALVEIEGFSFTVLLSAEGATGQMIEGKLSKALSLIDEFGGPELYSLVEEYDLVPLGVLDEQDKSCEGCEYYHNETETETSSCQLPLQVKCVREAKDEDLVPLGIHDAGKDLDEFVEHDAGEEDEKRPSGLGLSDEGIEATEAFINGDDFEDPGEDAADAMCEKCNGEECCGIPWVTELAASMPEPVEGEGWEVPMGLHEDPEFGDGRYTSPKEVWAATQTSDTPQNEYEFKNGGPTLAQEATMSEGYVKTATRIIADGGFVIVARPQPKDQAEGFAVQRFASINLSHARALRNKYGYSIGIAAQ